jgi:hypothetical protein
MTRSLQDALDETLGFVQQSVDRIRSGDRTDAELHDLRAHLLHILESIGSDPSVEAASDDLYSVAKALIEGPDRGPDGLRLLTEAFQGLLERLWSPNTASKGPPDKWA